MTMLQPAPGCAVRDPDTMQLLDPAGEDVTLNDFYIRRLQCGDVIDMDAGTLKNAGVVSSAAHHHRARGHGRAKED
jgi:Protein of unknown function (DUF2635)